MYKCVTTHVHSSQDLHKCFPPSTQFKVHVFVVVIFMDGGDSCGHIGFPARVGKGNIGVGNP